MALLREVRRRPLDASLVALSGSDPLNLVGTLLPGALHPGTLHPGTRVPALSSNRLLYRDGVPVASLIAGTVHFDVTLELAQQGELRDRLIREPGLSL
ncbi:hypothetical protein D3C80_1790380 [compost metagenome]